MVWKPLSDTDRKYMYAATGVTILGVAMRSFTGAKFVGDSLAFIGLAGLGYGVVATQGLLPVAQK